MSCGAHPPFYRAHLAAQFEALGVEPGDHILVHAALRSVGPILGGPDTLIRALQDTVGVGGTILAYCDWQRDDCEDPEVRPHIPPFDPLTSRSIRENGAFPELLRTTPGARRSESPGASCAALGSQAQWFTANHSLDYGYGEDSPFGRLVEAGGKTMLIGAPLDTITLLHHAEHLARIPNKRVLRYQAPIIENGRLLWRWFEEFNTGIPIVDGLPDDYFADVVMEFLSVGKGRVGQVGNARTVLVGARDIVEFAVNWLERRYG